MGGSSGPPHPSIHAHPPPAAAHTAHAPLGERLQSLPGGEACGVVSVLCFPCFSSCTPFARLSRVLRGPRVQGARSRGRRCVTAWFHIFPVLHPSASARSVARQSPPARGGQIMTHPGAVRISTTYATQAARTWDTERVHTRAGASCCALADCCTGWAGLSWCPRSCVAEVTGHGTTSHRVSGLSYRLESRSHVFTTRRLWVSTHGKRTSTEGRVCIRQRECRVSGMAGGTVLSLSLCTPPPLTDEQSLRVCVSPLSWRGSHVPRARGLCAVLLQPRFVPF